MKRLVAAVLACLLGLGVCPALAAQDTPEATAQAFTEAVAAGDFEAALDLYTAMPQSAGMDWERQLNRIKAYTPQSVDMPAPTQYEAYQPLNEAIARGRAATYLYLFMMSFLTDADELLGTPYAGFEDDWPAEFAVEVDPSRLSELTLLGLFDPNLADEERTITLFQEHAAVYGADEKVEKLALYGLGDRTFMGGFSFLRYGDAWYIAGLSSALAAMNAYGTVTEVPAEHLEAFQAEWGFTAP